MVAIGQPTSAPFTKGAGSTKSWNNLKQPRPLKPLAGCSHAYLVEQNVHEILLSASHRYPAFCTFLSRLPLQVRRHLRPAARHVAAFS